MIADVWAAVPALVWAALIGGVLFAFRRQVGELLPRLRGLKVPGVDLQFNDAMEQATTERGKPVDPGAQTAVERRADRDAAVLAGGRVLWVDDEPDRNARERQALRAVGIDVESAVSNDEALVLLRRRDRDVVVSDIARPGDAQAGLELLAAIRALRDPVPLIFYVGAVDPTLPTPAGAFAITDHPIELMHAIFDVLERRNS